MTFTQPITLSGQYARLEPLSLAHQSDLIEAVNDGELWKLWYTSVPEPAAVQAEIERRLGLRDKGSMLPFAIVEQASGQAVGMTTYMNIDAANRRDEIGCTWYRRSEEQTDKLQSRMRISKAVFRLTKNITRNKIKQKQT